MSAASPSTLVTQPGQDLPKLAPRLECGTMLSTEQLHAAASAHRTLMRALRHAVGQLEHRARDSDLLPLQEALAVGETVQIERFVVRNSRCQFFAGDGLPWCDNADEARVFVSWSEANATALGLRAFVQDA